MRRHIPDDTLAPNLFVTLAATLGGWRVVEVPVTHLPRERGSSTLRTLRLVRFSARGLFQLVSFRRKLARGAGRDRRWNRDAGIDQRRCGTGSRFVQEPLRGLPRAPRRRVAGRGGKPPRFSYSPSSLSRCGCRPRRPAAPPRRERARMVRLAARRPATVRVRPGLPRAGAVLSIALADLLFGAGDWVARLPRSLMGRRGRPAVLPPAPDRPRGER